MCARCLPLMRATSRPGRAATTARPGFPYLRRRDGVALIGLCIGRADPALRRLRQIGRAQLGRVAGILRATRDEMRVRAHSPPPGRRRRQHSQPRAIIAHLAEILLREGAELVLHGHSHSISRKCLAGPHGPIPVLGICSASSIGRNPRRRAAYYLIDIDPSTRKMMLAVRQLDQNGLFHQVAAAAASCVG